MNEWMTLKWYLTTLKEEKKRKEDKRKKAKMTSDPGWQLRLEVPSAASLPGSLPGDKLSVVPPWRYSSLLSSRRTFMPVEFTPSVLFYSTLGFFHRTNAGFDKHFPTLIQMLWRHLFLICWYSRFFWLTLCAEPTLHPVTEPTRSWGTCCTVTFYLVRL